LKKKKHEKNKVLQGDVDGTIVLHVCQGKVEVGPDGIERVSNDVHCACICWELCRAIKPERLVGFHKYHVNR